MSLKNSEKVGVGQNIWMWARIGPEDGSGGEGEGGGAPRPSGERDFSNIRGKNSSPRRRTKEGWRACVDPQGWDQERALLIRFKKTFLRLRRQQSLIREEQGFTEQQEQAATKRDPHTATRLGRRRILQEERKKDQAWPQISLHQLQLEKTTEQHLRDPAPPKNGWAKDLNPNQAAR